MRDVVAQARPDLLEAASELVGRDPFAAVDEGTAYQQPAIFCASLAHLEALRDDDRPDCYAGHSLGEITALVAAGALSEHDGLRFVTLRGRLMQQVDEGARGAMVAIGASAEAARSLAERHGVTLAIDNAPRQVVLSGDAGSIARAQEDARAQGLRTLLLPVRVAAHTPALAVVAGQLRTLLNELEVRAPRRPCFSCVTARELDDVRMRLAQSLTRPVRWREVLLALHARGVRRFVDVGPGRALGGLVRATLEEAEIVSDRPLVAADA